MAAVCQVGTSVVGMAAVPAVAAAGVTWLASSVTAPLVGGVLGGVSSLASIIGVMVLKEVVKASKEALSMGFFAIQIGSAVAGALIATALGYPISIPLTLLLIATNIASLIATVSYCCEN